MNAVPELISKGQSNLFPLGVWRKWSMSRSRHVLKIAASTASCSFSERVAPPRCCSLHGRRSAQQAMEEAARNSAWSDDFLRYMDRSKLTRKGVFGMG